MAVMDILRGIADRPDALGDVDRLAWLDSATREGHENLPIFESGMWRVVYLSARAEGVCEAEFGNLRDAIDFAREQVQR